MAGPDLDLSELLPADAATAAAAAVFALKARPTSSKSALDCLSPIVSTPLELLIN